MKRLRLKEEAKPEADTSPVLRRTEPTKLEMQERLAEAIAEGNRWAAEREERFFDGQEFADLLLLHLYKLYQRRNSFWADWRWQDSSLVEERREVSREIEVAWDAWRQKMKWLRASRQRK